MLTMDDAMKLIMLLVIVVSQFLLYRSIPMAAVEKLLKEAEVQAKLTPSPVDDVAVSVGKSIVGMLRPAEKKEEETLKPASPTEG